MEYIKIKQKYIFFKFNLMKNEVSKIVSANNKKELQEKIKGKKIASDNEILLMKFEKKKEFSLTTKSTNSLGGPIKVTFYFYELSPRGSLKKKEDPRAIQLVYYTLDYYLKHNILSSDLLKLALLAFQNKLEKRLLAPKLITQINKI
jgi:hypothetical protein